MLVAEMKSYQPVEGVCHVRLFRCVLCALGRHEAGGSLGNLGGVDSSEYSGVAAMQGINWSMQAAGQRRQTRSQYGSRD